MLRGARRELSGNGESAASTEAETGAHLSSGAGPQEWALVGASERRTKYET